MCKAHRAKTYQYIRESAAVGLKSKSLKIATTQPPLKPDLLVYPEVLAIKKGRTPQAGSMETTPARCQDERLR